ncbi:SDR family oxidoreductase [Belnapia sp. F-4-1]|uniref:SDR family oxidoreductase n=1 Tax=Belnapia sp. F-4-1 TaxID=1545443 RepID=UPI0005BDFB5D|nr:SDR family oxidoreductase [Belnapia sp. F-4-1]
MTEPTPPHLLIAGLGYTGKAVAREASRLGFRVTGTSRTASGPGVISFATAGEALAQATHLLVTAAPGEGGDPVLATHTDALAAAPALRWIGYLSTTGIYGDRAGAWVDEATPPAPGQDRSRRRLDAEDAWRAASTGRALDIFRVGGIYGPGRSAIEEMRAGTARRTLKPGHAFSRIHRDDIAQAVAAALRQSPPPGVRILHLVDDEPAESALVTEEAARLLGLSPPPAVPYEEAARTMSPMGRSFWAENRRVANAATKAALGITWRYPTYRKGLAAILRGEG